MIYFFLLPFQKHFFFISFSHPDGNEQIKSHDNKKKSLRVLINTVAMFVVYIPYCKVGCLLTRERDTR